MKNIIIASINCILFSSIYSEVDAAPNHYLCSQAYSTRQSLYAITKNGTYGISESKKALETIDEFVVKKCKGDSILSSSFITVATLNGDNKVEYYREIERQFSKYLDRVNNRP
jgi:hypothetical protein